jgi:hypothetical protein
MTGVEDHRSALLRVDDVTAMPNGRGAAHATDPTPTSMASADWFRQARDSSGACRADHGSAGPPLLGVPGPLWCSVDLGACLGWDGRDFPRRRDCPYSRTVRGGEGARVAVGRLAPGR